MSEYKCIRVTNKELSKDDFKRVYDSLCRLETGLLSEDGGFISFFGKSEKKTQFSVDLGCNTTELRAFMNAIHFYLGEYEHGVEVKVFN